jgi:hypothetical protein
MGAGIEDEDIVPSHLSGDRERDGCGTRGGGGDEK